MTVAIEIFRGNESLALSGGSPYWFLSLTGLGLPPIRRLKERSPQQNGSTDVGYLLDERYLNLALLIESDTDSDADAARDALAEMLKPLEDNPLKFRVTREDGQQRQIDCNVAGVVDFPHTLRERMGPTQLVVVQFECPDPIPYDPTLRNLSFAIESSAGASAIPMIVPFTIASTGAVNSSEVVNYAGMIEARPIIYVTGPAENLVITNETTGYILDFTGHTIADGDTYTIDLPAKRIYDQDDVRKLSALTDASNLFKWALATTPQAVGGINTIRVEIGDLATISTQVRFEYYDRYASF